jgi:hypothetical protein
MMMSQVMAEFKRSQYHLRQQMDQQVSSSSGISFPLNPSADADGTDFMRPLRLIHSPHNIPRSKNCYRPEV